MGWSIESIEVLLLIAAIVGMIAHRLRLPYTVGLLLAGILLAVAGLQPQIALTKDLIYRALLPPLVFEAALHIPWRELRRDLGPILLLATVGVLLSAALTAAGMHYVAGWGWGAAALFGSLIAATDPVSVIAVFKETGVRGRLRVLLEAESLLNDGTAAVLFALVFAIVAGGQVTPVGVAGGLLGTTLGGILCGLLVGAAALLLAGRTQDPMLEITFTTVAAYGSFLAAEHFHLSGVLSALTAGLLVGNAGSQEAISGKGRPALVAFWEYAAFVANSLIFLLIGVRVTHLIGVAAWPTITAIVLVTLSRAVAVYPLSALFRKSRHPISLRHQHVLFWGGLRGAVALALVLGLPADLPQRDEITAVAFGVVMFSILVQGMTMPPLLRALKVLPPLRPPVARP